MVLHALVVWQGHGVPPAAPLLPELKVSIRPASPPPAAPTPAPLPKAEPAKAEPAKPPPEPRPPPPKPPVPDTPPRARSIEPRLVPAAPAPTQPPVPAPAPAAPAPAEAKAEARADAPKAASPPAAAASSSAEADERALVRSYEIELANITQKYKVYPRVALDQEWEGTAQVRVRIGADTRLKEVEIISTSGHDMLDEKAQDSIRKAVPRVRIPDRLRGKEFVAEVRVIFKIEK